MKQLIIILLVLFSTNRIFCQSLINKNYDHKGISEFAKHTINYKNGFIVLSNIKSEKFILPSGILIRMINEKGDLLWSDFYKDEKDSLKLLCRR